MYGYFRPGKKVGIKSNYIPPITKGLISSLSHAQGMCGAAVRGNIEYQSRSG